MKNMFQVKQILKTLRKDKKLTQILYTLNEIPFYAVELSRGLQIPIEKIKTYLMYLKKNKLIKQFTLLSEEKNKLSVIRDNYPIILLKKKRLTSGLSPDKAQIALKKTKFYYSTEKGSYALSFIDISNLFSR